VTAPIASTGLSGLAPGIAGGVSTDTQRLSSRDNLEAAGNKFEAIFVNMMVKSMRTAKLADGLLDSKAGDQFRDMQDQKLAESMAAHAPIGIGKAMVAFLAKTQAANQAAQGGEGDAAPSQDSGQTAADPTKTGSKTA
jgi:peptidoglycan hydrolase FlgJ